MSTQLPLRTIRIPTLQRRCLFQRRNALFDRSLAVLSSRAISTTPSRPLEDRSWMKYAAAQDMGPAPSVQRESQMRESKDLVEDIGILQNTIIRAPFKDLPGFTSRSFWRYFRTLFKSKGTALYSRSVYHRLIQKEGLSRWLPVDLWKGAKLKNEAKKLYVGVYRNLASGKRSSLKKKCLPPLFKHFESRIIARGPLKMSWRLVKWKSARIVSDRAAPLGDDMPDTAFRQVIVRLESVQSITRTIKNSDPLANARQPVWVPEEAKSKLVRSVQEDVDAEVYADNGKPTTVVEYLVMQTRVLAGKEEEWKVWGFTDPSTPQMIEEDEAYWRRTLNARMT